MLAKKREARKVLKRAVREHSPDLLIKRARAFTAAQRKSREAEKEAKMARQSNRGRRLRLSHLRLTKRQPRGLGAARRRGPPRGL